MRAKLTLLNKDLLEPEMFWSPADIIDTALIRGRYTSMVNIHAALAI